MLTVTNMDDTVRFYCDVLGFSCTNRMEGWAALQKEEAELMIALPNEHVPFDKPTLTGSLYFNTDDVDAVWAQVKDNTTVVYPIENFSYGMREFAIRDNNGYCLQFGQEITDPSQIPAAEDS
jgi:uncharacterized glyoxalase superfamily protein PhnB